MKSGDSSSRFEIVGGGDLAGLTEDEANLVFEFRRLNKQGREKVVEYAELMAAIAKYRMPDIWLV